MNSIYTCIFDEFKFDYPNRISFVAIHYLFEFEFVFVFDLK